jgi:adenylate kinase
MIWVFLGAPGAGKGTQAKLLAEHLGIPHVSTGDLLRAAVSEGTELGRKARSYMEAGELVPDELMLGIVRASLEKSEAARGCILDGYPRNVSQAESLDGMLREIGQEIGCVVNLEVSEQELMRRIAGRQGDEGRVDDDEATLRNRLRVYEAQTAPLVNYYGERGVLRRVPGEGSVEEIQERIRGIAAELEGAAG